jgi:hypothetical protein
MRQDPTACVLEGANIAIYPVANLSHSGPTAH